ncbi:TetR/AcrR family transcriptional regulator [Paenibacillus chitinolyticus]|uniref:TetR/AcrR family transcriptional regulator n=1 Tax=Paenibacillus chitinolyticus TaxID=79263 RepID=UPI001C466C20|nr:TetR/AcrR family transcriptional regulator [Paenibacillus chitinolyticus]MBV6717403.1 TetR/AcrR family transcriptional regulator [Paenibacillus chitinolyticus]
MVQVLKEELRQAVIKSAQVEFAQFGYAGASMKRIAAQTGISVGNLYRYYKDKEDLFDSVISPVYHELETLISNHHAQPHGQGNIFELIVEALTNIVVEYRTPLLILIDGARGTRNENAVQKFHQMMADNVAVHLADYSNKGGEGLKPQVAWPVSVAFLQGYFEIIRLHEGTEDCKRMVRQYLLVWFQGLQAIL